MNTNNDDIGLFEESNNKDQTSINFDIQVRTDFTSTTHYFQLVRLFANFIIFEILVLLVVLCAYINLVGEYNQIQIENKAEAQKRLEK